MSDEKKLRTGYSWEYTLRALRSKRHLRPLEPVVKDFEKRISELERQFNEHTAPKPRGRPKGSKNKGKDNE